MKRIDEDTIALTQQELDDIREFIQQSLDHEWVRYTDNVIRKCSWAEGVRSMNPEMYDFSQRAATI